MGSRHLARHRLGRATYEWALVATQVAPATLTRSRADYIPLHILWDDVRNGILCGALMET